MMTTILLTLITVVVISLILAFEVWMFIDALHNPRLTDQERLLWCVGMVFIHPFVAIMYYFLVRANRGK